MLGTVSSGVTKGGWQKVSPAQKPAKTVKGAIPPTITLGVWNLSGIFATPSILSFLLFEVTRIVFLWEGLDSEPDGRG